MFLSYWHNRNPFIVAMFLVPRTKKISQVTFVDLSSDLQQSLHLWQKLWVMIENRYQENGRRVVSVHDQLKLIFFFLKLFMAHALHPQLARGFCGARTSSVI